MSLENLASAISFALTITLPNLLLMGLGFFMHKKGDVNKNFIDHASKIVFNYCLPCLLFFSVVDSSIDYSKQIILIATGLLVTFTLFLGAELYAKKFIADIRDQGVFVQGVFRSNMAIISLAIVSNAYGNEGMGIGAVYMGVVTIVYNILAVITLSRVQQDQAQSFGKRVIQMGEKIIKNPLIIALVLAFLYKAINLPPITGVIYKTGSLLAAVSLPLALICAGATIDLRSMLQLSGVSMQASFGRIIIAPLLAIAIGLMMGLHGIYLGILYFMVASPAAAASYVMAKAMGNNDILAANILAFTTVFSMIGMAIGSAILKAMGMI